MTAATELVWWDSKCGKIGRHGSHPFYRLNEVAQWCPGVYERIRQEIDEPVAEPAVEVHDDSLSRSELAAILRIERDHHQAVANQTGDTIAHSVNQHLADLLDAVIGHLHGGSRPVQ